MAEIVLEKVTKVYGDGTVAVRKLDLEIPDGGFTVLVGPSGCGKTTALRMIAGLEEITSGVIRLGGRVINDVQPKDRDLAMVFQNYALYPHMSVYDNIAFGLRLRRLPASEIRPRVEAAASTLGLSDQLRKKPRQLSGGPRGVSALRCFPCSARAIRSRAQIRERPRRSGVRHRLRPARAARTVVSYSGLATSPTRTRPGV
jgi:multiple sugar transport system ATP-binding protein